MTLWDGKRNRIFSLWSVRPTEQTAKKSAKILQDRGYVTVITRPAKHFYVWCEQKV